MQLIHYTAAATALSRFRRFVYVLDGGDVLCSVADFKPKNFTKERGRVNKRAQKTTENQMDMYAWTTIIQAMAKKGARLLIEKLKATIVEATENF